MHTDEGSTMNFSLSIYPTPLSQPIDPRVPNFLKSDLEELRKCLSISAYRAVCGLARRILQHICIDKGADQKKDLIEQIDELAQKSIITKSMSEWAHLVRYVGNNALHPDPKNNKTIEKDDAEEISDLVDQIIHILYIADDIAKSKREKFKK